MAKNTVNIDEVPIDKVEQYLEQNFKKILIVVASIIVVTLAGYMFQKSSEAKKSAQFSKLGEYEVYLKAGTADEAKINEYLAAANELSEIKDYVNYNVALHYINNGNVDKAMPLLKGLNGSFAELRDSLLYDMGQLKTVPSQYLEDSYYKSVWNYRNIVSMADKAAQKIEVEKFGTAFENSQLTELLNNWE